MKDRQAKRPEPRSDTPIRPSRLERLATAIIDQHSAALTLRTAAAVSGATPKPVVVPDDTAPSGER